MSEKSRPPTPSLLALHLFEHHLYKLLPLYSASFTGDKNQVIKYCTEVLKRLDRAQYMDKHFNLLSPGCTKGGKSRAIVAHTDAVGVQENVAIQQGIGYNFASDIIYNKTGKRPIGGDDKVGVAIALTIGEIMPDVSVWLFADEEVGLVGSNNVENIDPVDLAIQFDRRGAVDLIPKIGQTNIASKRTAGKVLRLLTHRVPENGGSTDVAALVRRNIAQCAFNFSCGYYAPHTAREYIVYAEAQRSLLDALAIMLALPDDDIVPADQTETLVLTRSSLMSSSTTYSSNVTPYKAPTGPVDTSPKATAPTGATVVAPTTQTVSTTTAGKSLDDSSLLYSDGQSVKRFYMATQETCFLCGGEIPISSKNTPSWIALIQQEIVCSECLKTVSPTEAKTLVGLATGAGVTETGV